MPRLPYDEIGYWSEVKLDIIREYAAAYTTILSAQKAQRFHYLYIDAFAGAGQHISKRTGEFIPGSPLNALNLEKKFHEYHFIDLNELKVAELEKAAIEHENVHLYLGDCNEVLIDVIFPRARYEDYRRALCLLDPYGLHLDWRLIQTAGQMKSIEIFLNFPIMDINMNVLKHNKDKVDDYQAERMTRFWGDESWRELGYEKSAQTTLFGDEEEIKVTNEQLEAAFRHRIQTVAGFDYVPEPMPMRNSKGSIVYFLYFASKNKTGGKIVKDIFRKYSERLDT